ncbi:MAG: hypothetical protein ACK5TR_01930 [Alphaproteobacteria bacterium]|jgi:hypothetical protein
MKKSLFLFAVIVLMPATSCAVMAEEKCPQTLSYQDIQDVLKPDGKTVKGLILTPKSLPDYLSNMPQGDVSAKLNNASKEGANLVCTYVHHGGITGAGTYKLEILAKVDPQK